MKKVVAASVLALGMAVAPVAVTQANPIDDATPACSIYVSYQPVPLSAHCEPYYVNGTLVYNAISVNE